MKCPDCGIEPFETFPEEWGCICGMPEEPQRKTYINHCWNCKATIDSRNCVRSSVRSNGYHCCMCGVDLVGNMLNDHQHYA